jgi:hypothetical protein
MISNIFSKNPNNNFFQNLILPVGVFIIGFFSFFSYMSSNTTLDSIILTTACISPFYPFIVLLGQCAGILFASSFFNYLPVVFQTSFNFNFLTSIVLFYILRLFIYGCFFKKILEKCNLKKIINIFLLIGIFNVFLYFLYLILITLVANLGPITKFMTSKEKLKFYIKSIPYILKQFDSIKFQNLSEITKYYSIGANSMILNIKLFFSSYMASIFFSIIVKDPNNEMFQKFDRSLTRVDNFYKLLCGGFFLLSLILIFLQYNLLALIVFSIFISFFFIFFIIGQNLLLNSLLNKTGNFLITIIIIMLLMELIPLFPVILIILGFVISIFNI